MINHFQTVVANSRDHIFQSCPLSCDENLFFLDFKQSERHLHKLHVKLLSSESECMKKVQEMNMFNSGAAANHNENDFGRSKL